MTREQAKNYLIALGLVEPTDEQISSYLNSVNGEVSKEKLKVSKAEDELNALKESAKELEAIKKQNMSEIELANTERDEALKSLDELKVRVKKMELISAFAEKGIVGEKAEQLIDSMANGSIDVALLGEIIQAKQEEAVNGKIAELSAQTIQPNSGSIDTGNQKTDADIVAERVVASLSRNDNASTVIDAYK